MATRTVAPSTVRELSPEDFRTVLEERSRKEFGVSLDEFMAAFEDGKFRDNLEAVELALLVGARTG
jgi:DNA polymerase III sliding clamp (beta) subunit (PCNA family)